MDYSQYFMKTLVFAPRRFVAGSGNWLIDDQGERALDFYSDTGTASVGYHSVPQQRVLQRLLDDKLPIHAPNVFPFQLRDEVAKSICERTGMDNVFFCNSGAEAVEAAIKVARKTQFDRGTVRVDVWGVKDAFHGRTLATLAVGDDPTYHREGFGPLPAGFYSFKDIGDIRRDAAAVCIAPVYGNYDLEVYQTQWLQDLRRFCTDNGILLIFDEVMTGAGRAGGNITYGQAVGVSPDIVAMAKGVAMGCPVGVCLARGDAARALTPGSHFSTFGGNPLSCAFLGGMLDWLSPQQVWDINRKGDLIRTLLEDMPWAHNVRGAGMLNGFDLQGVDKLDFARECLKRNLLVGLFRPGPGPVKITPPLSISDDEIEFGIGVMDQAYRALT